MLWRSENVVGTLDGPRNVVLELGDAGAIVLIGLGFREASGAGKHTAYSTTLPYTQANTVTNQRRHKSHANVYYLSSGPWSEGQTI